MKRIANLTARANANAKANSEARLRANSEARVRVNAEARVRANAVARVRANAEARERANAQTMLKKQLTDRLGIFLEYGTTTDADMKFVIDYMDEAGLKRLVGETLSVLKLKGVGSWLFQQKLGAVAQTATVVRVREGVLLEVSSKYFRNGPVLDPCDVALVLTQVTGTCYFNAAIHMLCLGPQSGSRVLRAVYGQVKLLSKAEQDVFETQPINLSTCPAKFSWLDVLRVFYAVLVPDSPSRWHDNPLNNMEAAWNLPAEIIYTVGHRRRHKTNAGTKQVGTEGGYSLEALTDLCGRLGISCGPQPPAEFLTMKYSYVDERIDFTPETIRRLEPEYALDSCGIVISYTEGGRRMGMHAISGTFCEGNPIMVDSHGLMARCDWVTNRRDSELRAEVQTAYNAAVTRLQPLTHSIHGQRTITWAHIECVVFVKKGLMGATS